MSKEMGDFSQKFKELEKIAAWFEGDNFDLDEGLRKYEKGMKLAGELREYLEKVQNKVEVIKQGAHPSTKEESTNEASGPQ